MSEALSLQRTTTTKETEAPRTRVRARNTENQQTEISGNTFFQIIFSAEATPEQKIERAAKALVFTEDQALNRARIKEFESFKEYLHEVSEKMSKERIKLTDTEVFAELQRTYGILDDDLQDFFNKIKPLTDITDALYKMRIDGKTRDVLSDIRAEREWDASFRQKKADLNEEIDDLNQEMEDKRLENFHLAEQKGFFGFGQIKPEAMAKIKSNEAKIEEIKVKIDALLSESKAMDGEAASRKADRPNSHEMEKIRELLDLNSEEHTARQADMVASALNFVESGKERFGSIRQHLNKMVDQIEGLGDNNSNMTQIIAVLNEATKNAEDINQVKRQEFSNIPEDASLVEKMKMEGLRQQIDDHIDVLSTAAVDTMQTYGELSTEAIKIRNMQAATKKQVESARSMHSRGISSVASQLSTVLTAVNAAGINEAQAMASNTLQEMARVTNAIAQKEAIRIATSRDDINVDLEEQLKTLMEFGDNQRKATEITHEALSTMRDNLSALKKIAEEVQEDTREFVAVAADVIEGDKGKVEGGASKAAAAGPVSPFSL